MEFQIIKPNKSETYEIAYDDHCLVVKSGDNKVWISKAMAKWIVLNFAEKTKVEIVLVP